MSFATLNGSDVTSLHLVVGATGPWYCDFTLDTDSFPFESSSATLIIYNPENEEVDALTLVGTISTSRTGVYGASITGRLVAGADGWRKQLSPKNYANDAGVKARSVADDLAREVGEELASFEPTESRVGSHYVRPSGQASQALSRSIGSATWWVDYDGKTHVGLRPETPTSEDDYEVLDYDPKSKRVELACNNLTLLSVGSILTKAPLDAPLTIRDLEVRIDATQRTIIAWGGSLLPAPRLAHLLQNIVRYTASETIHGVYLYRVFRMASDRVELQCASKATGLPDLLPINQWSGIPGTHAQLTPGTEVLVGFIEGDRTRPYIQSYVGKGGPGHAPVSLDLGGTDGAPAARQGDAIEILLPPAVFSGTIGGTPATGVLTFPLMKASGTIVAGSGVVKIK